LRELNHYGLQKDVALFRLRLGDFRQFLIKIDDIFDQNLWL